MKRRNHKQVHRTKSQQGLIEDFARRRGERTPRKRFLIVCEDEKSAKNYFVALIRHLRITSRAVVVEGSDGKTQPVQVVKKATTLARLSRSASSGTVAFDRVWAVIDGDFEGKIANARSSAAAHNVMLAVTNKCFEYWLLLHFEENNTGAIQCDCHLKRLKRFVPAYEKGSFNFSEVVSLYETASKRAKDLRLRGRPTAPLPESQNPCSELFLLIEDIVSSL